MRVLMLVATSVATDTRVVREAVTLVAAGHTVHIIGKDVPADWNPPAGITVGTVGATSALKRTGASSLSQRQLSPPMRMARWMLLPEHRNQAFARWARGVGAMAGPLEFDVVHAHDFTALEVGHRLSRQHEVPLIYDTHELWSGRPRVGRPTPLQQRREAAVEKYLGNQAAEVITVGQGVADELRARYGWDQVRVVRNTFATLTDAERAMLPAIPAEPTAAVYAGRLAPYRELEVIAAASGHTDLPITLLGPADETWLARFDAGKAEVRPSVPVVELDAVLAQSGIALVTHSDRWANHRLAMPNKLFHAIRVGIPVVATDVGELGRLMREHQVGELYAPGDAAGLVRALAAVRANYAAYRANVALAETTLSWKADAKVLVTVYSGLEARKTQEDPAGL